MSVETPELVIFDARLKEQKSYWIKRLGSEIEPSSLIPDYARPVNYQPAKTSVDVTLPPEPYQKLVKLTGNSPFLIYATLVSALNVCLRKYTGNDTIVLGSPALKELGRANVVTVVSDVRDEMSFRELLLGVRQTLLDAYERQEYPFTRLIKDLPFEHVNNRCPIFDITLALTDIHGNIPDLKSDMAITFTRNADEIRGQIEFNSSLFKRESIERFRDHFVNVLGSALNDVNQPVREYDMLSEPERQHVLFEWNNTATEFPKDVCVQQLFEEQVTRTPSAVAAAYAGKELTYLELNRRANQVAGVLREKGVQPNSIVGIMMNRSPELLVAVLGVLKAGGAYLPIDLKYPEARVEYILKASNLRFLLTEESVISSGKIPAGFSGEIVNIAEISSQSGENLDNVNTSADSAYVIYTSGSTGQPKGVVVRHSGLTNYVSWAKKQYLQGEALSFPLFSSLSFDLTVTSIFVPLISGGTVVIYPEDEQRRDLAIYQVIEENAVDVIKLTPAHLSLVREIIREVGVIPSRLKRFIVGGEQLKTELAKSIHELFGGRVEIYNEYGPTEAVVGSMVHRFDPHEDLAASVPIGTPVDNVQIYVLDQHLKPSPVGAVGELYISGAGVAKGYLNAPELTSISFVPNPFRPNERMYRTGDVATRRTQDQLEFLGRMDHQVKIRGVRVELGEVEGVLLAHPDVTDCVVDVLQFAELTVKPEEEIYCAKCGLPSSYPNTTFDSNGVCNMCLTFEPYEHKALQYFKTRDDLVRLFEKAKSSKTSEYDCLLLFSGGKDSTYLLYQLVDMGLRVLTLTLDNGYISEAAKANILRVVEHLNVDHVFASTPYMNEIFVDSLNRFSNVCNGCFKTIYTFGLKLAHEKGIKHIATGLSRGQLFETRLMDLFRSGVFDADEIDRSVLDARKQYHRTEDVISQRLDTQILQESAVLDEIQFVDCYRYLDVKQDEIYAFLAERAPWVKPKDTGRSSNCLINDVGIYVHKKEQGYHNYALPYSWEVRIGHRTREAVLDELHFKINEDAVKKILVETGFNKRYDFKEQEDKRLIAYIVCDKQVPTSELRAYLSQRVPDEMMPAYFVKLEKMPLTANGKVDRKSLPKPQGQRPEMKREYVAPRNPAEAQLAGIWSQLLGIEQVGINDNFFELGGHSLLATQVISRVRESFHVELTLRHLFQAPTIAEFARMIGENSSAPETRATPLVPISRDAYRMKRAALTESSRAAAGEGR